MSDLELIDQCYEQGWTDGLPVIPPVPDRVASMVGNRDPKEIVAILEPGRGIATIEKIAANAVMAGCLPEYFPVVLAAVRAAADPAFGLEGVLTTIHSQSPMVVVNGPIAEEIGMNSGAGVLGSGNRANATIGRALMLVSRNIAGARAGALDPATLGHPGKYSYCIAENETSSPWQPFHVDRGFARDESTVTLYAADAPLCLAHLGAEKPDTILRTIGDALPIAGTYNLASRGELALVMSPEHARICADAGMTKQEAKQFIFENCGRRSGEVMGLGVLGFGESLPKWVLEGDENRRITPLRSPDQLLLFVAGGDVGGYTAVIFGGGRSVTHKIERD